MFLPLIAPELPIRLIERNGDTDYFIDLDYRSLEFACANPYLSRLQYPLVRALLIRTSPSSPMVTVHILKDSDLYSSICNFEVDLSHYLLEVHQLSSCVQIYLSERSSIHESNTTCSLSN